MNNYKQLNTSLEYNYIVKELFDINILEDIQNKGLNIKSFDYILEDEDNKIKGTYDNISLSDVKLHKDIVNKLISKGWFNIDSSRTELLHHKWDFIDGSDFLDCKTNVYKDLKSVLNLIGNITLAKITKKRGVQNQDLYLFLISKILIQILSLINEYEVLDVDEISKDDGSFKTEYKIKDNVTHYFVSSMFINKFNIRAFRAILNYCEDNNSKISKFKKFFGYIMKNLINGITELIDIITDEDYVVNNDQAIPFFDYRFIPQDIKELGYLHLLSRLSLDYTTDYPSNYLDSPDNFMTLDNEYGVSNGQNIFKNKVTDLPSLVYIRLNKYNSDIEIDESTILPINLSDNIDKDISEIKYLYSKVFGNRNHYVYVKDDIPYSPKLNLQKYLTLKEMDHINNTNEDIKLDGYSFIKLLYIDSDEYEAHKFFIKVLLSKVPPAINQINQERFQQLKGSLIYLIEEFSKIKRQDLYNSLGNYFKNVDIDKLEIKNNSKYSNFVVRGLIGELGLDYAFEMKSFNENDKNINVFFTDLINFDYSILKINKSIEAFILFNELFSGESVSFTHLYSKHMMCEEYFNYCQQEFYFDRYAEFKNNNNMVHQQITNVLTQDILFTSNIFNKETKDLIYSEDKILSESSLGYFLDYILLNRLIILLGSEVFLSFKYFEKYLNEFFDKFLNFEYQNESSTYVAHDGRKMNILSKYVIKRINNLVSYLNNNIDYLIDIYKKTVNEEYYLTIRNRFKSLESECKESDSEEMRIWNKMSLSRHYNFEFIKLLLISQNKFNNLESFDFLNIFVESPLLKIDLKRNELFKNIITNSLYNFFIAKENNYVNDFLDNGGLNTRGSKNERSLSSYMLGRLKNKNNVEVLNEFSLLHIIMFLTKNYLIKSSSSGVNHSLSSITRTINNHNDVFNDKTESMGFSKLLSLNSHKLYSFYKENKGLIDSILIKMSRNNIFKSSGVLFLRIMSTIIFNDFDINRIEKILKNMCSNEEIQFNIAYKNTMSNILYANPCKLGIASAYVSEGLELEFMFNSAYNFQVSTIFLTQVLINAFDGKISEAIRYISKNSYQNLHNFSSMVYNLNFNIKSVKYLNIILPIIVKRKLKISLMEQVFKIHNYDYSLLEKLVNIPHKDIESKLNELDDIITFRKASQLIKVDSMDKILPKRLDIPRNYEYKETGYKVHFHKHNDIVTINLGNITNCCQTIGGAAQSCVIEGIMNPYSGFISIQKDGKIIAQSWIWLSLDKRTLVIDSIETKYLDQVDLITKTICEWGKLIPYDIAIGASYTKVTKSILRDYHFRVIETSYNPYKGDPDGDALQTQTDSNLEKEIQSVISKYSMDPNFIREKVNEQYENMKSMENEINEIKSYYNLPIYPTDEFTLDNGRIGIWTFNRANINEDGSSLFKFIPISFTNDYSKIQVREIVRNVNSELNENEENNNFGVTFSAYPERIYSDSQNTIYYLKK